MCQMYECNMGWGGAEDIQLKAQCIIISQLTLPPPAVSQSPSGYITSQCQGRQPVEDKLRGSSPMMQLTNSGLSPAACVLPPHSSLSSSCFPLPYPPTHPPTSPPSPCLSYTHIHTYTQSRMHRDCSNSSSTARWRSPLRVWVPIPGECRDKSEWVSVMLEWGVWGRREGENGVGGKSQERDISEDPVRFWGNVCLLFFLLSR